MGMILLIWLIFIADDLAVCGGDHGYDPIDLTDHYCRGSGCLWWGSWAWQWVWSYWSDWSLLQRIWLSVVGIMGMIFLIWLIIIAEDLAVCGRYHGYDPIDLTDHYCRGSCCLWWWSWVWSYWSDWSLLQRIWLSVVGIMGMILLILLIIIAEDLAVCGGDHERGHGYDPRLRPLLSVWPLLLCCPHCHPFPPPWHWHRQYLRHYSGLQNVLPFFNSFLFIKNKRLLYPQRVSLPLKKHSDTFSEGNAAIQSGVTAHCR